MRGFGARLRKQDLEASALLAGSSGKNSPQFCTVDQGAARKIAQFCNSEKARNRIAPQLCISDQGHPRKRAMFCNSEKTRNRIALQLCIFEQGHTRKRAQLCNFDKVKMTNTQIS